jgi:hypothetical protein
MVRVKRRERCTLVNFASRKQISRHSDLEDGLSIQEVMDQFDVTREQIKAVLEFAARSLDVAV